MAQGGQLRGVDLGQLQMEQGRQLQETLQDIGKNIVSTWQQERQLKEAARQADMANRQAEQRNALDMMKFVIETGTVTKTLREGGRAYERLFTDLLRRADFEDAEEIVSTFKEGGINAEGVERSIVAWASSPSVDMAKVNQSIKDVLSRARVEQEGMGVAGAGARNAPARTVAGTGATETAVPPKSGRAAQGGLPAKTERPPVVVPEGVSPAAAPAVPPAQTTSPTPAQQAATRAITSASDLLSQAMSMVNQNGGATPQVAVKARQAQIQFDQYRKYMGLEPSEAQRLVDSASTKEYQNFFDRHYPSAARLQELENAFKLEYANSPAGKAEAVGKVLESLHKITSLQFEMEKFPVEMNFKEREQEKDLEIERLRNLISDRDLKALMARLAAETGGGSDAEKEQRDVYNAQYKAAIEAANNMILDKDGNLIDVTRWGALPASAYNSFVDMATGALLGLNFTEEEIKAKNMVPQRAETRRVPALFEANRRVTTIGIVPGVTPGTPGARPVAQEQNQTPQLSITGAGGAQVPVTGRAPGAARVDTYLDKWGVPTVTGR